MSSNSSHFDSTVFNSNIKLVILVDRPVLLLIITFILLLNPFFEETCFLEEDLQISFDLLFCVVSLWKRVREPFYGLSLEMSP